MSKWFDAEYVMAYLEYVPIIDIVRCKECKWAYRDEKYFPDEDVYACKGTIPHINRKADDFCSYGERRE